MRKNSPKEKSQRLRTSVVRGVLALVLLGLLAVPIAVQAELKATSLAYTWDIYDQEWEWGHATVIFDGQWIPLLQEVYFDHLDRLPEFPVCEDPTEHTRWAGWIDYGLSHLDTDPPGARGFQGSDDEWYLIDCDLDGDGDWDRDDLLVPPIERGNMVGELASCSDPVDPYCQIAVYPDPPYENELWQDLMLECPAATSEHCTHELSTRLIISLDLDCDGEVDEGTAADLLEVHDTTGLCVYSWAETPDYEEGEDVWTFPLPVRITDADGAKTLMLYPVPTAVELASFSAEPQGSTVLVSWETATELDNLGFNLYRASAAGGERVQLNERLIASQSLGSTVGSSYEFVDRSAEPGTAYEYWLEDIDLAGVAGMNGPVAVQMPRIRLMPCRPRPAPMPGQWE